MVQFLHGVSNDVLFSGDFSDLRGLFFTHYHGIGTLCGASFPLFAKNGNTATHVNLLGNVVVQCHNFVDVSVINKICVEPCMHEHKGCCWVSPDISYNVMFSSCASLGCCGPTQAPSPAPTAPTSCTDLHPTCPKLKKQLDATGKTCFDDMGQITGDITMRGMHLVDE